MEIKAITLRQPWATLVALGLKHYETRDWGTNYRGRVLIHAAKQKAVPFVFPNPDGGWTYLTENEIPYGGIVAIADLANCYLMAPSPRCYSWKHQKTGEIRQLGVSNQKELLKYADAPSSKNHTIVPVAQDTKGKWHEAITISGVGRLERGVGDWTSGRYAWKLKNIKPCAFVPCKGGQRLWNPTAEILSLIEEATAEADLALRECSKVI